MMMLTTLTLLVFLAWAESSGMQDETTTDQCMAAFRNRMSEVTTDVDELRTENAATKRWAEELAKMLTTAHDELREENVAIRREAGEMKLALEAANDALAADIITLKEQIVSQRDVDPVQTAFSVVSHQDFGPVSADTNVPYEVVYTNIGGGWVTESNQFQAPLDGVYQFTASLRSYDTSVYARGHIVYWSPTNGEITMATLHDTTASMSTVSQTVIIEMEEGDTVSVKLRGDGAGSIYSDPSYVCSTFSGFLIFTLVPGDL